MNRPVYLRRRSTGLIRSVLMAIFLGVSLTLITVTFWRL